ncbi:MAG: carbohydrate ABC transporter permease, partial [Vallitaleaceae bacterium]|nr:carbohydrate ABC transporter permease [Vallitaleaceae bacterium]
AQYLAQNVDKIQNASLDSIPLESIRMAMGIIGIGPIILAYPFFQKYFIKGLTVGAIKE